MSYLLAPYFMFFVNLFYWTGARAAAELIAISIAVVVAGEDRTKMLDWHFHRGLSFLQLGLREIKRLCYQCLPIPSFASLPPRSPVPGCASLKKREQLQTRVEFSKVTVFST